MSVGNTTVFASGVVATAALTQYRAVSYAGAVPSAGANCMGFARTAGAIGDRVPVDMLGSTIAEAGAAITAGSLIELDSSGRAITRSVGAIVGRALTAAGASGDLIELFLIPN